MNLYIFLDKKKLMISERQELFLDFLEVRHSRIMSLKNKIFTPIDIIVRGMVLWSYTIEYSEL